MSERDANPLPQFIQDYCQTVLEGFETRWQQVTPEIYDNHIPEAIGGLLARQATLTIELAQAPSSWNGHIAPLVLRCQTDAHITLAWILEDPAERSVQYIHYGLGQEKLFIEHLEAERAESAGDDDEMLVQMIEARKAWLSNQLAEWATEVNVGSWSGMSARDMAREIGRESLYHFAYSPFSGPVHNMWQHVGIYNVQPCTNPMHKRHLVPKVRPAPWDPDFLYRSAKYTSDSYELFDEKLEIGTPTPLPVDYFIEHPFFAEDESGEEPADDDQR